MTNLQESRFGMFLTLREFLETYISITDLLPNFPMNSKLFYDSIPKIQAISELQKTSKKGLTTGKNLLKESLIVETADYARKLSTYAKFNNNERLIQEVKFTESKLKQVADTAVKNYAQIVYDRAQSFIKFLVPYGITVESQIILLNIITAYNASLGKTGAGRSEGSQTTKQLVALFKTADTALNNMNAAVEIIRRNQVNFYNGYKAAQKIMNTGAGTLSVKCLVTETKTGLPIKGVSATFALDGGLTNAKSINSKTGIIKKTAEKGGFNIKSLKSGNYQVSLKKAGYTDQMVTLSVNDGEMTVLNVSLEKL